MSPPRSRALLARELPATAESRSETDHAVCEFVSYFDSPFVLESLRFACGLFRVGAIFAS
jgi:hypothetical protein